MSDFTNPVIKDLSPTPASVNNSNTSTIEATLDDGSGSGIDQSTIEVTVNGTYAIDSGVVQPGFGSSVINVVSSTQIGLEVRRDESFDDLQSVNVSISARDHAGNPAATRVFSFITEDNSDAIVINPTPERDAIQVPTSTEIFFNIRRTPRETELDRNSLSVTLTGLEKVTETVGGTEQTNYEVGPNREEVIIQPDGYGQLQFDQREASVVPDDDGLGFSVTITPLIPLPTATIIGVRIKVTDEAGNVTEEEYSFATVDTAAPFILNQDPAPNSISNSIATTISFSIGDSTETTLGSGVDKDTLEVIVDGETAINNGIIQPNFTGLIDFNDNVNGYDVDITRDSLFSPRKSIPVRITAEDFSENTLRTSYAFSTEDVVPPEIVFVYPKSGSQNVPQDAIVIIDFESEVAVEEIDLNSLEVKIGGTIALIGNDFQSGFTGSLSATNRNTLSIAINTEDPFILGSNILVEATASDVFGNSISGTANFTITTQTSLQSTANPPGGIYDNKGATSIFPPPSHGSFLAVMLQSNKSTTFIAYTIDGSDPVIDLDGYGIIDGYGLGTTKIFDPTTSSPIRFPISETGILRYFAFDPIKREVEDSNTDIYSFSDCPEQDIWDDIDLQTGLEYTGKVSFNKAQFLNNTVTNQVNQKIGTANYIHDLGRVSYIDQLLFNTFGIANFRVRVADTREELSTTEWCNTTKGVATGESTTFKDGYGPKISLVDNFTHIEGRSETTPVFSDEAVVEFEESLGEAFQITGDIKLPIDLRTVVGGKAFFRLFDDVFNLEIQQYVSKVNAANVNTELVNQSSLVDEEPQVFIDGTEITDAYGEGYLIIGAAGRDQVTDGNSGFVTLDPPPAEKSESIQFAFRKVIPIDDELLLEEDTTGVFNVISTSPAIYNTFKYNSTEVQELNFSGNPNFGTFSLKFGSETTAPLLHSATASQVEQALENLSALDDVTVTGDFQNGFRIDFAPDGYGVNHPEIEIASNTLQLNFTPIEIRVNTLTQGGIAYSSAKVGTVRYIGVPTEEKTTFAISVADRPLDDTLATVSSLNLDARLDKFVPAETSGVFFGQIRLREGDYNFRFSVTYDTPQGEQTRAVANPFIFKTRQDLSSVQSGDKLVVDGQEYELEGTTLIATNEYVLEFLEKFPQQPIDIPTWTIRRNGATFVSSTTKITVDNPLEAVIGTDASGAISNIVVDRVRDIEFTYISSTATHVSVVGTFNNFNPTLNPLIEEFDPTEIGKLFDLDLTEPYLNTHVNFHKVVVEPLFPTIVDKVRFYTGVPEKEKQRTRLIIDGEPMTRALYRATKQNGDLANYVPQDGYDGYGEQNFDPIVDEELEALPELIVVDESQDDDDDLTSSADLYSSEQDGFIEWNFVEVGTSENTVFRSSVELLTRFDSFSGNSREHNELEIFTLPGLPQFVSDFTAPTGARSVIRKNKSSFAASSNNVTVDYARRRYLEEEPVALDDIRDDGVIHNFFRAVIEAPGPATPPGSPVHRQVYVDVPHIFEEGEKVVGVTLDSSGSVDNLIRTEVTSISQDGSGLVNFKDPIVQEGYIVKDYIIEETPNEFLVKLEVPDFSTIFYGIIFEDPGTTKDVIFKSRNGNLVASTGTIHGLRVGNVVNFTAVGLTDALPTGLVQGQDYYVVNVITETDFEISETPEGTPKSFVDTGIGDHTVSYSRFNFIPDPEKTTLFFENTLNISSFRILGGRFTYPLLPGHAKVIEAENIQAIVGSEIKEILKVVIDKELLITHNELGGIIEIFNDTKLATDYIISKTDGEAVFANESLVSSGEDTIIDYRFDPVPFQVPNQMWCFDTISDDSVVEIRVEPERFNIVLEEISNFAVDFFHGIEAQAPQMVQFEVNDSYVSTVSLSDSEVIDGYQGDFDSNHPNTGSIRQFVLPREDIITDGYVDQPLQSLSIKFTGRERYCIGELESLVTTDLINTQCRVVLNDEELFRSTTPSGPFARYSVRVNEGLVLVFYNGRCVVRRPLVFQKPTFQFGAAGKVFDDLIKADFRNISVDRYFVESPAKIEKVGRFVEIEGTVIS